MHFPVLIQPVLKLRFSALGSIAAASALAVFAPASPAWAAQQAVELLRFHCEGELGHRAVHIYQAGSKKSGEGSGFGKCNAQGQLGACMTEPFEGSTPIILRNSSVQSSNTSSVTTICHTVADRKNAPNALNRSIYGAGISLPATGPGVMSAGGTGMRAAIDFVYSASITESSDLIANDGRWKREDEPASTFRSVASADEYLKKISTPTGPRRIDVGPPVTAQSAPGDIKARLIAVGCNETAVAGEYVCTTNQGLSECKAIGLPSKVATKCGANIEAVIPVDIDGCKRFLGRATEQLCTTQAGFDACKASVDQQKATKCTKVGTGETYTFHKSKAGIVGCDDFLGRATENLCFAQSGFDACKAAVDKKQLTKCINSVTKETYAHTLTKAEKLAKLAQIGCVYNNNAADSKRYKTATCKTEASYKQCEAMVDKADLLDCALKTQ